MPLMRRGTARKKYDARRTWLSARPEAYVDVPGIHDDVTEAGRAALDRLQEAMQRVNLFGGHARETQREAIRRLVSELRGEQVQEIGW